jgi:hypothetical protein
MPLGFLTLKKFTYALDFIKIVFLSNFQLTTAWCINHSSSNQPLDLYYKYQFVLLGESLHIDIGENMDFQNVCTTVHIYTCYR